MKKLLFILMVGSLFAERQVKSQEILDKINNRISIKYENIIVDGNLNFTSMYDNNTLIPTANKTMLEKALNIFINIDVKENKVIISNIEVPIEFLNCTFIGKVIGWENDDNNGISYKAVFKDNAIFSNCIFKDEVLFKYTEFNSEVSFAGSTFMEEANFKYSIFPQKTTFSGNKFNNNANFKYTKFYDTVDFSDTNFNEKANFKYTKFPKGVSFENAVFSALSNFKYTEFTNPLNFEGTIFNGEVNFKNTTLDGKKFTNHISQ